MMKTITGLCVAVLTTCGIAAASTITTWAPCNGVLLHIELYNLLVVVDASTGEKLSAWNPFGDLEVDGDSVDIAMSIDGTKAGSLVGGTVYEVNLLNKGVYGRTIAYGGSSYNPKIGHGIGIEFSDDGSKFSITTDANAPFSPEHKYSLGFIASFGDEHIAFRPVPSYRNKLSTVSLPSKSGALPHMPVGDQFLNRFEVSVSERWGYGGEKLTWDFDTGGKLRHTGFSSDGKYIAVQYSHLGDYKCDVIELKSVPGSAKAAQYSHRPPVPKYTVDDCSSVSAFEFSIDSNYLFVLHHTSVTRYNLVETSEAPRRLYIGHTGNDLKMSPAGTALLVRKNTGAWSLLGHTNSTFTLVDQSHLSSRLPTSAEFTSKGDSLMIRALYGVLDGTSEPTMFGTTLQVAKESIFLYDYNTTIDFSNPKKVINPGLGSLGKAFRMPTMLQCAKVEARPETDPPTDEGETGGGETGGGEAESDKVTRAPDSTDAPIFKDTFYYFIGIGAIIVVIIGAFVVKVNFKRELKSSSTTQAAGFPIAEIAPTARNRVVVVADAVTAIDEDSEDGKIEILNPTESSNTNPSF